MTDKEFQAAKKWCDAHLGPGNHVRTRCIEAYAAACDEKRDVLATSERLLIKNSKANVRLAELLDQMSRAVIESYQLLKIRDGKAAQKVLENALKKITMIDMEPFND